MLSEGQKRKAQLSVLEKLRRKGMPERSPEEDMNSMFGLEIDEEGKVAQIEPIAAEGEATDEEQPIEVPLAPGKRSTGPQPAVTPLPIGGTLAKPKKKRSVT